MLELDKILAKCRNELVKTFGPNMVSLTVFGSAAADDYQPGKSDINLLVVLTTVDVTALEKLRKFSASFKKYRVAAPLVLTRQHIERSNDVFPIEFLEIQEKNSVLAGEDLFTNMTIETKNLRHECEHELKGRLIRLRQSFMESGHKAKELKDLLLAAHNANFPAFRTALRLKSIQPPTKKENVTAALAEQFELNKELFLKMKLLREDQLTANLSTMQELLQQYLTEVEKLAQLVDGL